MSELAGKVAVVVGASRGLGRGIAEAFIGGGASVVAIARDPRPLRELAASERRLELIAADATDPAVAGRVLAQYHPDIVALVAGAAPPLRALHLHSWETFSTNWQVDVRMAFHWVGESLRLPLRPGSRVVVMSSGAAVMGSPLSGGYAGAKATQRFIADYAAQESERGKLGIRFAAILPRLTPATGLGRLAVAAYSARLGIAEDEYRRQLGAPVTPAIAGDALLRLVAGDLDPAATAYMLTADGLQPLAAHGPAQPPRVPVTTAKEEA